MVLGRTITPKRPGFICRGANLVTIVSVRVVSLLPFATAWIARTRLASSPVVFYAAHVPERTRRMARRRSLVVLVIFTTAMLVAFVAPRFGFGLICGALILHLRPEAPGSRR